MFDVATWVPLRACALLLVQCWRCDDEFHVSTCLALISDDVQPFYVVDRTVFDDVCRRDVSCCNKREPHASRRGAKRRVNILILYRVPEKRKDFIRQLQIVAAATEGKRMSELPAEWFDFSPVDDYKDFLRLASRLNHQARLIDEGNFLAAHAAVEDLLQHFDELPKLIQFEQAGEYVFTELLTENRKEIIDKYWTKEQVDYVKNSARFSSSKQRILFANALFAEKDTDKAQQIYHDTLNHQDDYLILGEVRGDLALMKDLLEGKIHGKVEW